MNIESQDLSLLVKGANAMSKEKQIIQLHLQGFSQRRIADSIKVSRNTIAKVLSAFEHYSDRVDSIDSLNDEEIHRLLFPEEQLLPTLVLPDFDYVHKELLKSGVTLRLLWDEYVAECRDSHKPPYMYSQFCKLYQDHVNKNRLTMHISHKPGDKVMVDWVGTTLPLLTLELNIKKTVGTTRFTPCFQRFFCTLILDSSLNSILLHSETESKSCSV